MKLSEINKENLYSLPWRQKEKIVYGKIRSCTDKADVAVLLGADPDACRERAAAAAELYALGGAKYILPTGGVLHDMLGGQKTESEIMKEVLLKKNVPSSAILLESEARNTAENFMYASIVISRELSFDTVRTITVVTSRAHLRRSLILAKQYLPSFVKVFGYPTHLDGEKNKEWYRSEKYAARVDWELTWLKKMIDDGTAKDIEF